jgi:hypothetical protein
VIKSRKILLRSREKSHLPISPRVANVVTLANGVVWLAVALNGVEKSVGSLIFFLSKIQHKGALY